VLLSTRLNGETPNPGSTASTVKQFMQLPIFSGDAVRRRGAVAEREKIL